MFSVYAVAGLFCGIALWINHIKRRKGTIQYPFGECVLFYLITRFFPALMLGTYSLQWMEALGLDLLLLLVLCTAGFHQKLVRLQANHVVLYLLNPAVLVCIAGGHYQRLLLLAAGVVLLCLAGLYLKKQIPNLIMAEFYPEFFGGTAGFYLMFLAMDWKGQTFAECFRRDGGSPQLLLLAFAVLLITEISICRKLLTWEGRTPVYPQTPALQEPYNVSVPEDVPPKMQKKDWLAMLLLTLLYAGLIFFRLGSREAPETLETFGTENGRTELVLELGEETKLSKLSIYLGHEGKRNVSLSYWSGTSQNWELLKEELEITSAFCWNDISLEVSASRWKLTFSDTSAELHEVVLLNAEGEKILPENAVEYVQLFDEQQMYPEYATYYYRTMFDEVYHGRTAYEFLHELPFYENTHPPLGKSLISIGIALFGMNPFGWRFICALTGILIVPFLYAFAWRLTRRTDLAVLAAILSCTEFMHFTLSRISTLDSIVALFMVMMFYYMYCFLDDCQRNRALWRQLLDLLLCGGSMALAVSVKWTGLYAAAGICVLFFLFLIPWYLRQPGMRAEKKRLICILGSCVVFFLLIPALVYIGSYVPFVKADPSKGLLGWVWENAKWMLNYHVHEATGHPYASEWYEWMLDRRPLLDAWTALGEEKVSSVATFGNPLVWWGGLAALLHNVYLWRCRRDENARTLCVAYAALLLPWLLIHRTVFIYQYYGCSLILVLLITYSIARAGKNGKRLGILAIVVSVLLFTAYYPVLSGFPVKLETVNQFLELFTTWTLA